ncbi:hypothetical protein EVG20_g10193 [Dentipellis fragilis]|uniref:Uncharacterized protein n=1 Tax=Dentipellis fragilis TaxID=205917 RepID=A0A4Y9XXG0_9AGAM|nr:hypothetical protein EVG20_g10193 [Dentipellis fragilis]
MQASSDSGSVWVGDGGKDDTFCQSSMSADRRQMSVQTLRSVNATLSRHRDTMMSQGVTFLGASRRDFEGMGWHATERYPMLIAVHNLHKLKWIESLQAEDDEWEEDEDGYDEVRESDADAEAEKIARRMNMNDQLWAEFSKAQAEVTASFSTPAPVSRLPQVSSNAAPPAPVTTLPPTPALITAPLHTSTETLAIAGDNKQQKKLLPLCVQF